MGLSSAINTALFGLNYNQRQIDITASNVSNANTAGYSQKSISAKVFYDGEGNVSGLISNDIVRSVNEDIQTAYFGSLAETKYAGQIAGYTDRLDEIFGTIGDGGGLNSTASELANAVAALVNDPGGYPAQLDVLSRADTFARELNASYQEISDLRQQADSTLASQTETVNDLLASIADVDATITEAKTAGASVADLLDQRDRFVEQLSGYLDVTISAEADGKLLIRAENGQQLLANNQPSTVSFVQTGFLQPGTAGNSVTVTTPAGTSYDLLAGANTGSLKALAEIRDEVLVEAQAQLDTIAAEVSLAFSNNIVESTATTVGPDDGYVLDVSGLQAGNEISLTYTDTAGATQTVTFVAVSDPTLLPLADTATANPNDTVYGLDISSGNTSTYIASIVADLAGSGLQVSDNGGNLQILGDTTALPNPTTVSSLSAEVTPATSSDGLGFNLFVDQRERFDPFTDALENGGQRVGYAAAITVNPAALADSSQLVIYQSPANSTNDPARAQYIYDRLTNETVTFDPGAGIGNTNSPYEGNILSYINQTVAYQGNQAQDAQTYSSAKETLTTNLALRYEESYAVDVDAEMAFLIELQNAYTANARVMQTANELFDELLRVI
ncbi:flagellar hook-associated protein 1 FlgK [Roseibium hamelinense]|uniref:Flagellar hook-associated protein 1 n=1 Tax=Roseibium hamelinense TaxID=150831 RepID=A0A562TBU0_9HYPH|nr:flagellar hook-associated protein FlgK [Roseibium hamelinense]MTI45268.1 flagellar hook-associated protein FlgK [Roseibium hamelinense]TWI90370.1 flagellar hook-associated protein 1 FlgK [Roseibium hamelinense]